MFHVIEPDAAQGVRICWPRRQLGLWGWRWYLVQPATLESGDSCRFSLRRKYEIVQRWYDRLPVSKDLSVQQRLILSVPCCVS